MVEFAGSAHRIRSCVQSFLARFLCSRNFFSRSSSFRYASFGTERNFRTALSIRSAFVLPGT